MQTKMIELSNAIQIGDEELSVKLVKEAIDQNIPALEILNDGLILGIKALSKLFKDGEAFLPEILFAVRAMDQGVEVLKPKLGKNDIEKKGNVVLGTVEGDIHNIGKDLVGMMLRSNGYNVIDIGVDVTPEAFIDAIKENNPDILGMSALLTTTIPALNTVIEAAKSVGIRDKVKILVGGAAVSQEFATEIGADGYAIDCVSAVDEADRLMIQKKEGC